MNHRARHHRDRWQRRISNITRGVAAIAVIATLALSVVAARTFAGKTAAAQPQTRSVTVLQTGDDGSVRRVRVKIATPAPSGGSHPKTSQTGSSQSGSGSAQPAPPATTSAPPATVSGGS